MKTNEEKRLRWLIARFERVKPNSVDIISAEPVAYKERKILADVKGFKYIYLFQNDVVVKSWRMV